MAKNYDQEMFDALRARGLRKKMARAISVSAAHNGDQSAELSRAARSLRMAADLIEHGPSSNDTHRKTAARKAASTRKSARATKRTTGVAKSRRRPSGPAKSARGPAKRQSSRSTAASKRARPRATSHRRPTRRGARPASRS